MIFPSLDRPSLVAPCHVGRGWPVGRLIRVDPRNSGHKGVVAWRFAMGVEPWAFLLAGGGGDRPRRRQVRPGRPSRPAALGVVSGGDQEQAACVRADARNPGEQGGARAGSPRAEI